MMKMTIQQKRLTYRQPNKWTDSCEKDLGFIDNKISRKRNNDFFVNIIFHVSSFLLSLVWDYSCELK